MKSTIIYLRTSTEEQTPELQLNDCLELIKRLNISKDDCDIVEEKKSAFKDDDKRVAFNDIGLRIKKRSVNPLIVWDLDRLYRNRKKLIAFFELCKAYNCKIYSYRQQWLEELNNIKKPFDDIMHQLMLQVMGWLSEEESQKKSDRIRLAVRKKEGESTKSFKGNKWGRKEIKNKKMISDILELHKQGLSLKVISQRVQYNDKNNNKINRSVSLVWKIVKNKKENKKKL